MNETIQILEQGYFFFEKNSIIKWKVCFQELVIKLIYYKNSNYYQLSNGITGF